MATINKEEQEAREHRERLRKTRMAIILGSAHHYFMEIVKVMDGLGIKDQRIARRLSRGKALTPTQFYKIS